MNCTLSSAWTFFYKFLLPVLRIDPGCGTRVTFMPPIRINFLFWREDPVVEELRALASMHVPV